MKESPQCPHCHSFTEPVFNIRSRILQAWICGECELERYHHYFRPPTGSQWEQELTPHIWGTHGNVVGINYRARRAGGQT